MSKVNFVSEFNAIMRYARDNCLPLRERMLWIALFYIANDRAVYNEQTERCRENLCVKETSTSTRRRSHFVYNTVNHTAPIFKMGFSFTEQASCGKASILLAYNEESLNLVRADSFKRYANTHSHCRGHRFESGMLHFTGEIRT